MRIVSSSFEEKSFESLFHVGPHGRIGIPESESNHIRDMMVALLLTSKGERVNIPQFGCGLREFLFMGNNPPLASLVKITVSGSIENYLGDFVTVDDVDVEYHDGNFTAVDVALRTSDYRVAFLGQVHRAGGIHGFNANLIDKHGCSYVTQKFSGNIQDAEIDMKEWKKIPGEYGIQVNHRLYSMPLFGSGF